jgi:alanyl-tRNA synthetase
MESAKASGAMALFGEKYGDEVRVLAMGDNRFSVELCGGTHVERTGDIGFFRIISEAGIAAGVRRIEAVTGVKALADVVLADQTIAQAASMLRAQPSELVSKVSQLLDTQKTLEKELQRLQQKLNSSAGNDLMSGAVQVGNKKVLVAEMPDADAKSLRDTVDQLKQAMGSGVVVLAATGGDKIALVAGVTDDLIGQVKAGDIIKGLATELGGKGGGKPQFAQGGGVDRQALPAALNNAQQQLVKALT